MKLNVFYRISDAGNQKDKLPAADKKACLSNAIRVFGASHFYVLADNCSEATIQMIRDSGLEPRISHLGNAGSFLAMAGWAIQTASEGDAIYFLEDDYLHFPDSPKVILDGLRRADYVSLYDHPDKYTEGVNPFVERSGEWGRILAGEFCHWKTSNSTTMSFALRYETLKQDFPVWEEHCRNGYPDDFHAFLKLQSLGSWENRILGSQRVLISSLPSFATHTEMQWLAPLRNWQNLC